MLAFIIRRVLQMVPTVIGAILLLFVLFNLFGGDPANILVGKIQDPEKIAAIRASLGLDQPWWIQLWLFFKQVITFDFGNSWSTNEPVSQLIAHRAPVSMTIMLQVWLLDALIAVSLAMAVAYRRGSLTDRAIMGICTAAMSISLLLYVVVGQYVLGFKLDLFPVLGWSDSFVTNVVRYAPLPVMLLLAVSVAPSLRLYRSFIVEETNQDYTRTARAKGAGEHRVMFVHVLRNATIPIATYMAMQVPQLFVGSFLIEKVFSIPGLGQEIVESVMRSDFPVIKAITISIVILTMVINLVVDLLYKALDPRVELK
ncbi:ABC transporter permease [Chitinimonas sp. BJB300]|uniref:ABC transporter permease n=1 Tax=Chitinimonas sp. BJB300 TaxID=1559339 RepID=UPI000C112563|nr:ABC transporter permease [Chitinimonas sp. BJB300]PHV10645.1 peptide ABC transporter permease [Chitinimonas sp. BJB300]TSJ83808.1 ABC transporter permease [Chitinimonas sp. BJB300]